MRCQLCPETGANCLARPVTVGSTLTLVHSWGERADEGVAWSNEGGRMLIAPALTTVPADEPPGFHIALAFHVDEPHRLRDEVVAQELPGRTRDLDLV
jgi:hypothetical protein